MLSKAGPALDWNSKSRFQINDPFILSVGILYSPDVVALDADAANIEDESSDEE